MLISRSRRHLFRVKSRSMGWLPEDLATADYKDYSTLFCSLQSTISLRFVLIPICTCQSRTCTAGLEECDTFQTLSRLSPWQSLLWFCLHSEEPLLSNNSWQRLHRSLQSSLPVRTLLIHCPALYSIALDNMICPLAELYGTFIVHLKADRNNHLEIIVCNLSFHFTGAFLLND